MLANLVRKYEGIIISWAVTVLDHDGPNLRLKAQIEFRDHSVLFIRQVLIGTRVFKYAYHWKDSRGNLICRWDNAPHWRSLSTYPHHKHTDLTKTPIEDAKGGDLSSVFEEIYCNLKSHAP
ncbi:MAG: DUF6516 family protein [Verrucomicrobia bacterium]|nr:DUF6516 family protein [Verrucomicrobiota bacterium]MCF7708654.1 DUF6516 family protein [Verrucomicrobiota bacterium]